MKLKWPFLFLLIGLPVSIYLFLQAFGENQFTIPIYFENGVSGLEGCEGSQSSGQYLVDNLLEETDSRESGKNVVYGFTGNLTDNEIINLHTFLQRQQKNEMLFVSFVSDSSQHSGLKKYRSTVFVIESIESIASINKCSLQLSSDQRSHLVLVDRNRRIRGYYDPSTLKEIDRLNTEIEILISNE